MSDNICCEATSVALPSTTPFGKVLSLGWYDGTTAGLVQCTRCSTVFKYDIVDWDSDQNRRIFAFSHIEPQEFDYIVSVLGEKGVPPRWPFWSPKWEFASDEEKRRITNDVDEHLAKAGIPEFLVISDRNLGMMFGVKRLTAPARDRLPSSFDGLPVTNNFHYWSEYISLQE